MKKISLSLLIYLLGSSSIFGAALSPFNANYTLKVDKDIVANTSISLAPRDASTWEYQSLTKPAGWVASALGVSVTEISTLKNLENGFHVIEYRYERTGKNKSVHLTFDWKNMSVTNSINGDEWTMPIPDGTVDKLSINLKLMKSLDRQVTDISLPVADGGRLKYYDFAVLGKELLKTPIGDLVTIKLRRKKHGAREGNATFWMAVNMNYLPVRIEKKDKEGNIVTLNIQSFSRPNPL